MTDDLSYLDEFAYVKCKRPDVGYGSVDRLGKALRELKMLPKKPEMPQKEWKADRQDKNKVQEDKDLLEKHFQFLRQVKRKLG